MRPVTKGLIVGGVVLLLFYLIVIAGFFLLNDDGVSVTGSTIAVVEITGAITSSQAVVERLAQYRDNSRIKAIIVRIDSPGGAVGPSQEIFTEIRRTIKEKPVIASMGGTAASGGYYIAAACTQIVANPGTLTGSIGVIMEFVNVEGLFEWVGLKATTIKSGEFKDVGNYARKMTAKETRLLQDVVDDVQRQFVEAVSEGRGLTIEDVETFADGRILTGAQAAKLKLVDRLGNFPDAVELASELADIQGRPEVYWPKKKAGYLDLFLDDLGTKVVDGLLNRANNRTNIMYR